MQMGRYFDRLNGPDQKNADWNSEIDMELYLIRHAQSLNNALPDDQRVEDPALTEVGEQQAALLAKWITSLRLTRLIASPFLRTLLTAEPIHRETKLPVEVRAELHEQGGCYSGHTPQNMMGRPGMTRLEIEQRFPSFQVAADIDGHGWWRSQPHENHELAQQRAARLLERTREEFGHTDERVGYVMHADIKLLFLGHFHPEPLETPRNVSVSKIVFNSKIVRLEEYNIVHHLPPHLITS